MNFEALKGFLDTYPKSIGIPGTDTVIYKDHEPIFRYTAGYDSIERGIPMRPDGIYNLYSCTKIATGVIAARLIEEGKIQIYDPVYEYIPEFENVRVAVKDENGKTVDTAPAKSPMLIKHLLSMTSGINYNLNSDSIRTVRERTGGRAPTLDACRAIANEPLEFEPGADYMYGLSLDIMAGIVEVVTGVRFKEYMRDNLFAPLGMKEKEKNI